MTDERDWAERCAANPGKEWRVLAREGRTLITMENEGVFDELVVDHWIHVEQMDDSRWWARIGDARLAVSVLPDGRVELDVERGFYAPVFGKTSGA